MDLQYSLPTDGFICSPKAEHKEGSGAGLRGPSVPLTMAQFNAAQVPCNYQSFQKASKGGGSGNEGEGSEKAVASPLVRVEGSQAPI